MATTNPSTKRIQISKANQLIVAVVSIGAVVTAFSVVSLISFAKQQKYQSKVITTQKAALKVAEENVKAVDSLKSSYQTFSNASPNIIGGNPTGNTEKSGDNAKLVLDALPSQYDFPALVSTLEKILRDPRYEIDSLAGVDAGDTGVDPAVVIESTLPQIGQVSEMPFAFTVKSSYNSAVTLIETLDKVIRPISISKMEISGSEADITINVSATTYWQPAKSLKINTQVVK